MIIQEESTEKVSAPVRVESSLRDLADEPRTTGKARTDAQEQTRETKGEKSRLDKASIEKVLAEAEEKMEERGVALKFSLHEDSDEIQVEVKDAETGKVIRKIPSDEVLQLAKSIKDMSGVLMDKPA